MHLTAEQDGIYRRLIDHYMETRQPIPDNDSAIARITGISLDSWTIAAATIRPFFTPSKSGKLHHKRCDAELQRQDGRCVMQSEKGKLGAKKRWKKIKEKQIDNSSGYDHPIATPMPNYARGEERIVDNKIKKDNTNVLSKEKISLSDLSVSHNAEWLAEKRSQGKYLNHDEYFILEQFKQYCESKGKKYADYRAAYRNAFEWERCQPRNNTKPKDPASNALDKAKSIIARRNAASGLSSGTESAHDAFTANLRLPENLC